MVRVLLIEDNPADAHLIREYLREAGMHGFEMMHAVTLAAGRELIRREQPDVILLDLQLPDSFGLETFESLHEAFPAYPVIVLTGAADADDLGNWAVERGAQDFLEKGILSAQLLQKAISYAVRRQQMLRRLDQAQQMARVASWELDLHTNQLESSPQLGTLFGSDARFTTLADYIGALHPEDQAAVAQAIRESCEHGTRCEIDHRIVTKEGKEKYIALKAMAETDAQGRPVRLISTVQDITERKEIERLVREKAIALKQLEFRQEFLAKTSHEIRTPLNPILLFTGMLLRTPLSDEQRMYLNIIKTAGDTLLAVVNDILDLSKIEAGKIDFHRQNFSLQQVFDSIRNMVDFYVKEKALKLIFEIAPNVPQRLIGDTVRLTQILLNLLGNAIKFTIKGYICVSARVRSMENGQAVVEFSVKDTGIGIAQDKLKLIFDSFQQLDPDLTRRYGGVGLGLTIVRQLVQLQGGNISVESEPGMGSTFTFDLTMEVGEDDRRQPIDAVEVDPARIRGLQVLMVEDSPINQVVMVQLLKSWGIEIAVANNGREGLDMVRERGYHLILMDLQMPEMDGYEATRQIRRLDGPAGQLPIIALTADAFSASAEECFQIGMNDYISKPVDPGLLYEKILTYLPADFVPGSPEPAPAPVLNGQNSHPVSLENGAPMSQFRYINLDYLHEISNGDTGIIRKTIDKFLETTPEMLDTLDRHLASASYSDLGKAAHKLKSSVAFLGIESIRETIIRIESISKTPDDPAPLAGLVATVRSTVEQAYGELRAALRTL
ncbi:MAG: response regulator [Bacteroidia bacterium]|nr:response regulator [Bacteroidia bacterium]